MCESNHSAKEDNMRQARLKPDYQDTWHHCYNGLWERELTGHSATPRKRCLYDCSSGWRRFTRSGLSLTRSCPITITAIRLAPNGQQSPDHA